MLFDFISTEKVLATLKEVVDKNKLLYNDPTDITAYTIHYFEKPVTHCILAQNRIEAYYIWLTTHHKTCPNPDSVIHTVSQGLLEHTYNKLQSHFGDVAYSGITDVTNDHNMLLAERMKYVVKYVDETPYLDQETQLYTTTFINKCVEYVFTGPEPDAEPSDPDIYLAEIVVANSTK